MQGLCFCRGHYSTWLAAMLQRLAIPRERGAVHQAWAVGVVCMLRGGQSNCNVSQEVFDATGTPRCRDSQPPRQSRSFSFLVGNAEAGVWGKPPASVLWLLPCRFAARHHGLCTYTSFQARLCPAGTGIWKVFSWCLCGNCLRLFL